MADAEITLRLPQSMLQVILAHLEVGRHCDVAPTIATIMAQASPQLLEAAKIAEAEATAQDARGNHAEVH